jgi:heme A synthase
MQQDGTITFEPVVQTSILKMWHIVVAVFLFACVIYGVVWLARRHSENNGSLRLGRDQRTSGDNRG